MYSFRFYRFASASAFLAAWAAAGLPFDGDGAPFLSAGALDIVGQVVDADGQPVAGWHVNAAWPVDPPVALQPAEISPFAGLRAFAGWQGVPQPVPDTVTNWQARAVMRQTILPDGRSLERTVDEALRADRAAAGVLADADPLRIAADIAWLAWEQSNEFARGGALVAAMAARVGLTDADRDALFLAAAALEA